MNTNYSHLFRLDGRHALVVGAGSGIGREAALALAAHGALVICADTRIDSAIETASMADGLTAASLDVLDTTAVDLFVQKNSNIDVLVHTPAMNVRKAILDYSLEEFDRVVGLNLRSTFYMIQAFGRKMVARERGSIITFSSIRAATVEPGQSIYAATKSGLESIVRTAAAEFGVYGVRVNAIRPGVVETPLTHQLKNNPEWYNAYAQKSALGRWAKADEIAGAVVYLASDASSFVTGTTITVDGGWTAIDGRYTPPL